MSNGTEMLERYRKVMGACRDGVRIGRIKYDHELPLLLAQLESHLETKKYEKAVNTLEDIVLCYDMDDPKVKYVTEDILEACEKNVCKILETEM